MLALCPCMELWARVQTLCSLHCCVACTKIHVRRSPSVVPDCARLQESGAVFASPGCQCWWGTRGSQVPVEFPCPGSCGSSATVATCLCLWGCASTGMSSGPAGSCARVGGLQAAPEESRVQLGAQRSPGPAVLPWWPS